MSKTDSFAFAELFLFNFLSFDEFNCTKIYSERANLLLKQLFRNVLATPLVACFCYQHLGRTESKTCS